MCENVIQPLCTKLDFLCKAIIEFIRPKCSLIWKDHLSDIKNWNKHIILYKFLSCPATSKKKGVEFISEGIFENSQKENFHRTFGTPSTTYIFFL